ncbi:uncharacterized protein LOC124274437 [Haliotis rubra]|uniref:uncharacterized protein LOC124274437 n=1 Tax=Haliotis rubra TaxID=36100 RepID=UPI001EE5BCF1|nr:uncharacterized protein LOC124274437 [Haliotis rubra]
MSDERSSILTGRQTSSTPASDPAAIYHDSSQSPKARLMQILFVVTVVLMVLISLILSIYRGIIMETAGSMYFMLGISLVGFVIIEICMILFIRKGDLPKGKTWFLYFVGVCVILEAIFTDVLLFQ